MEYYNDEKAEDYIEFEHKRQPGDIVYVIDGMCGEYFIVGEVLKADHEGYTGLGLNEFRLGPRFNNNFEIKQRVHQYIKEVFNIEVEPQLIVMTHYS